MIVFGLTGSYGSGKSTVAAVFREMGVRVIDADQLAREVIEPGTEAYQEIVQAFGSEVVLPDGSLNREAIGRLVFEDRKKREKLESIIHPRVREAERQQVTAAAEAGDELVVLDVPLLFETGLDNECDLTCVVIVDEDQRMARLADRGVSTEEVRRRLEAQMPQEEKMSRADFIINNTGTLEQTRRQAVRIINTLMPLAGIQNPPKE